VFTDSHQSLSLSYTLFVSLRTRYVTTVWTPRTYYTTCRCRPLLAYHAPDWWFIKLQVHATLAQQRCLRWTSVTTVIDLDLPLKSLPREHLRCIVLIVQKANMSNEVRCPDATSAWRPLQLSSMTAADLFPNRPRSIYDTSPFVTRISSQQRLLNLQIWVVLVCIICIFYTIDGAIA